MGIDPIFAESVKDILILYYYEDENIFVDEDGKVVYNIFDWITPQDLYMFKNGNNRMLFSMINKSYILIKIIKIARTEDGGIYDANHYFNVEYLLYDEEQNIFTNEFGELINICDYITPDNLYLFRQNPMWNNFTKVNDFYTEIQIC